MAKALLGHLYADQRTPDVLASQNARLRRRVSDLEELVVRLSAENDRLSAQVADVERQREELQPV